MRREKRRHEKEGDSFKSLVYFFSGILGLAVITFVFTFTVYSNKLKKEQDNRASIAKVNDLVPSTSTNNPNEILDVSTQIGKNINEVENEMNNIAVESAEEINVSEVAREPIKEETPKEVKKTPVKKEEPKKELVFEKPVEGEIIFEYAAEKLVYSETLKEWITHPGIDIKAERTTIVKAAENGTVKAIKNDPRYGLTVIMEHEDGFVSVYSNLLTAEFVTVGEVINKGQTLGTVGNTATFESVSESHLHFELLKDNKQVDPTIYIIF